MKRIDITGQKFGEWTVGESFKKGQKIYYHCTCTCGTKRDICGTQLRCGRTTSCGCLGRSYNKSSLVGQRFGHLIVTESVVINHRTYWRCKCDCGNKKDVTRTNLTNGFVTSCGCKLGMAEKVKESLSDYCVDGTYTPSLNKKINSNNTSGVTGVSFKSDRNKWRAYIKLKRKMIHVGYFDSFNEAVEARKIAEKQYFGKYLNQKEGNIDD